MSAPKKPRAEQLQYPDLPEPDLCAPGNPIFALCAWMRATATEEALTVHIGGLWGKCGTSEALGNGLIGARIAARHEASVWIKELVEDGGLLYAFNGTTKTKGLETKGGAA